ncbi:MAG: hypothetical protein CM1200mP13_13750 [Candidatus Pelagibacterales bacterium]|nr:MAG: hypothetical protein CM1200mP13_13750 [Pelagibacterales bacterium]
MSGLFIGTMGTVPGHELVHRKKDKFDMFIGTGSYLCLGTVRLRENMFTAP